MQLQQELHTRAAHASRAAASAAEKLAAHDAFRRFREAHHPSLLAPEAKDDRDWEAEEEDPFSWAAVFKVGAGALP